MSTPDIPLRPWSILDHLEEQVARNRHLSFALGEIAGSLHACGHDPSIVPCGPSLDHFAAGIASAHRKLASLCAPPIAWHPFHTN